MTATSAIIPASGLGKRFGSDLDKTFALLAGRPLLAHTLAVFQECPGVDEIVLVVREDQINLAEELIKEYNLTKVRSVIAGGEQRQDSVHNGLAEVSPRCDIVAIHDGARPFVTCEIVQASIEAARAGGAAVAAVPVVNTIKSSPDGVFIHSTLDREKLYAIQTPQTFTRDLIEKAYGKAYIDNYFASDDAALVERLGLPVKLVQGSYENIKITTPSDIAVAEVIIRGRKGDIKGMSTRVGHGYDIHRFASGRRLFLGGVEFPDEEGLLGHSDADVLLHAVADAVLGAAGAGDIGRHFPDTDPTYKDASSMILLEQVGQIVSNLGWRISNIDVTLIAQKPRIAQYVSTMDENIAHALKIAPTQVNIKATTAEGLGPIGEELGIECHAVAMLQSECR